MKTKSETWDFISRMKANTKKAEAMTDLEIAHALVDVWKNLDISSLDGSVMTEAIKRLGYDLGLGESHTNPCTTTCDDDECERVRLTGEDAK